MNTFYPTESKINKKIETGIGPITDKILGAVVDKINTNEFKEMISDKVVEPITVIVTKKIQPYIYLASFMYFVLFLMLALIIYLLMNKRK